MLDIGLWATAERLAKRHNECRLNEVGGYLSLDDEAEVKFVVEPYVDPEEEYGEGTYLPIVKHCVGVPEVALWLARREVWEHREEKEDA